MSTSENQQQQIFKDISNFKTPKTKIKTSSSSRTFQSTTTTMTTPQFFTASKHTPSFCVSSTKRRPSKSAFRRLKAFELEQSQSCRKEQIKKERATKSLSRSLTTWLNFLFENPSSCGCDLGGLIEQCSINREEDGCEARKKNVGKGKGKRESVGVVGKERRSVGVNGGGGRLPKRLRETEKEEEVAVVNEDGFLRLKKFGSLRDSLKEVCSLDDLGERMRGYLSLDCCVEVLNVMTQVVKNIDEGRLKMKAHCPIVTDVGMREKVIKILMCYNPVWLRIGMYIIFGGESLLPNEDSNREHEMAFLKMVIEKQLLAHSGLAKAYAYNKRVDGLYRPGYFEALGNIILKRFLLLVLILDRGKSQSSLPVKYGIDGLDGGSPLLFNVKSNIKSSRQMINDFLSSDVMHGEGNLLAHLVIVGYKVSYQQIPLVEYDLRITDLFEDVQDGMRLCRAIHLLQHDSSILAKMVLPADTQKKKIMNCATALDYLKQYGVSLLDDDGTIIDGEDIASGEKESILALLWNMFVHLQLPLLISKTTLSEEISNIFKAQTEVLASDTSDGTHLDMLLNWMKAICKNYDIEVESLTSLVDGKVMWCLLDFYFRKELHCSCSMKELNYPNEESIVSMRDSTDAVHNFVLSQKLTTLMGSFPEVLQMCEILEYNGASNEKSVVILLVFLSSQLLVKKRKDQLNFHKLMGCRCQNPDRKWRSLSPEVECSKEREESAEDVGHAAQNFKAVQAWWQEMAKQNSNCSSKRGDVPIGPFSANKCSVKMCKVKAAIVIQSHIRRVIEHKKYKKMRQAIFCLQSYIQAWLFVKKTMASNNISACILQEKCEQVDVLSREIAFMVDRHSYVKQKSAAILIQKEARTWISKKCQKKKNVKAVEICNNVIDVTTLNRQMGNVRSGEPEDDIQMKAAVKIQSHFRGWLLYRRFQRQIQAALEIQSIVRSLGSLKEFNQYRIATKQEDEIRMKAAVKIQSHFRGWLLHRRFQLKIQAALEIQSIVRSLRSLKEFNGYRIAKKQEDEIQMKAAVKIQSHFRGWLLHRRFQSQVQAALEIQSIIRSLRSLKYFDGYKKAAKSALVIQSHTRGWNVRKSATQLRKAIVVMQSQCHRWLARRDFLRQKGAAMMIQSAFRVLMTRRAFQSSRHAAIEIQRAVRGRISRAKLLGASSLRTTTSESALLTSGCRTYSTELKLVLHAIINLQRWWKRVLAHKPREAAAVKIQSCIRGHLCRCRATKERQHAAIVQAHWKGYLARKHAKAQLIDLRLRIQKSAATVEDGMRLINRLITALKELKSMKNVSGILHNCATLNLATTHSQKCCERLVDEGAIAILLYLIRAVTRSLPDQEVLKHCLSTLRNLAKYAHLADRLISHQGSVEIILRELLKNKEEGYFIACELLKKLFTFPSGVEAARNLPSMLKRLHSLIEDLTRKTNREKRNHHGVATRDTTIERRLKEAIELRNLITQK